MQIFYYFLKAFLPLRTFHYGPMESELQKFEFKIGPLVCKGVKNIENHEIELLQLKSKVNADRIFFNVYGDATKDSGFKSLIEFDEMQVDSGVGKNFNLKTGEFKVPRKGTYEFSFSAGSCYQPTDIGIQKNGVTKLQLTNRGSGSSNQHIPISSNWLMNLDKGDRIQLKVIVGHVDSQSRIFTGKLLSYV